MWSCRCKSRHIDTTSCVTLQERNSSFERARRSSTFACRSRWSAWLKRVRTAASCASVDTTTATPPSSSHAIDLLYWDARSQPYYCCCVISTEFRHECMWSVNFYVVWLMFLHKIFWLARQAIKPICNNQPINRSIDPACSYPRHCQLWDRRWSPAVSWRSTRRWRVGLS